ncbi:MAG: ABC transporter permease [Actinobacteria bacterium]|nr:ABC transporter permease [Actinomycetota bacterium]
MDKKKPVFLYIYTTLFFIYIFAPIILIFIFAWNNNEGYNFPLSGFTWKWFIELFKDDIATTAMTNSAVIAVVSATISTILGTMLSFGLLSSTLKNRNGLLGLLMLPVLMPSLTIAIAVLVFFRIFSFPLGIPAVIFSHVSISISYVVLIVIGRIEGSSANLQEASVDLGASWFSSIIDVILPILMPAIIAGWVFSFMISWNEFIITYFLIGNNVTIPVYIFSQLRFGLSPKVNVISVLVTGFTIIMVAVFILSRATFIKIRKISQN